MAKRDVKFLTALETELEVTTETLLKSLRILRASVVQGHGEDWKRFEERRSAAALERRRALAHSEAQLVLLDAMIAAAETVILK